MLARIIIILATATPLVVPAQAPLPTYPLGIRDFILQFDTAGTFSLSGQGWPSMLVIEAGQTFKHITTNSMGETLMATPAISEGMSFVRGASTLIAIGSGLK